MKKIALYLLLALAGSLVSASIPMDEKIGSEGFWKQDRKTFMAAFGRNGFRFTAADQREARASKAAGLTYGGMSVTEALVGFGDQNPTQVALYLYTRGDEGEISESDYMALTRKAGRALSQKLGRGQDLAKLRRSGLSDRAWAWRAPGATYRLEASSSMQEKQGRRVVQPEFIRVRVVPADSARSGVMRTVQKRISSVALRKRVVRREAGDCVIESVPMVDQGQKGYCAVAVTERVMRYYGREIDQHELAQVAKTETEGGTSAVLLVKAIRKLALKLGVNVATIQKWDVDDFEDLLKDYNRAAKRQDKHEILLPRSGTIQVFDVIMDMEPELLRDVAAGDRSDRRRFLSKIQPKIDKGIPILWSVHLGILPEPKVLPQMRGGHMRLIIGYNQKTEEILYSDSWGQGHEEKRMPLANAATISTGMFTIEPR